MRSWSFYLLSSVVAGTMLIRWIIIGLFFNIGVRKDTDGVFSGDGSKVKSHVEYKKARVDFNFEYDRLNPITSSEKTKEYLMWLRGNPFVNFS